MLLTLGDSFTTVRYDGCKPWSFHLAEKMDKEHLNIAHEGESNSFIFRNAMWALTTQSDIDCVVLGLTNWDRFELPYNDYGLEQSGMWERTKTFKPKHSHGEPNAVSKAYIDYYSMLFYVDQTASYLIALDNMCKSRNIPLIVIQPLLPFNVKIDAVTSGELDFMFKKNMNAMGEDYVNNESLFRHVDKDIFCMFTPTSKTILFGEDHADEDKYVNLFSYFTRNHPELCMGYHNKYIYKSGHSFRKNWDGHPNDAGMKLISDIVYKHWSTEYGNRRHI